jgi:two-component system, cell cycle sensor histidine kinase and response regulator CckA
MSVTDNIRLCDYNAEPVTPRSVLVVDDERAVREVVAKALTRAGYRVRAAASAEEALELERAEPVDLLITDVILPGMKGPDLAREVRRRSPDTLVLFMSGYTGDASIDPGELQGGLGFLQKPFGPSAVVARVRQLLDPPDA